MVAAVDAEAAANDDDGSPDSKSALGEVSSRCPAQSTRPGDAACGDNDGSGEAAAAGLPMVAQPRAKKAKRGEGTD